MSMKSVLLLAVVSIWCLIAAPTGGAQQQTAASTMTVVQVSYYALPGKEQELLSIRLAACDVLEKKGITRGRVLIRTDGLRETKYGDDPDVVWEGEFFDRRASHDTKRSQPSTLTSLPQLRRCVP
jgi:hypothetical protein